MDEDVSVSKSKEESRDHSQCPEEEVDSLHPEDLLEPLVVFAEFLKIRV